MAAMNQATTLRLRNGERESSARAASWRELAMALAVVIALHVGLAVWVLHARAPTMKPPEQPRTIVAHLLSAAPAVNQLSETPKQAPTPPVRSAPSRPAPVHRTQPPHAAPRVRPTPAAKPTAPQRETREPARETPLPAPSATPAPEAAPAPATPPAPAAPPATPPAATAPTTPQRSASPAQAAANAPPKDVSHVDCNIGQPDYPAAARRRGETGTAVVRFVVGVDGRVESAKIERSSGSSRLDDAALAAVRGGTCHPWKEAGQPVRVAYAQPFVFGLGN